MIRTFVAVHIAPTEPLRSLVSDLHEFGGAVKPIAVANLHLTLKFLGDTAEALVPQIGALLHAAASSKPAGEILLQGLGAFPHLGRPSVIWVGLQLAEMLEELAVTLDEELVPLGFEREHRPTRLHLTVARVKATPPRELGTYLRQHTETDYGVAAVGSVELMRSEFPVSAPYTSLLSAPLAAGKNALR